MIGPTPIHVSLVGNVAVGKTTLLQRFQHMNDPELCEPTIAPQCISLTLTNEQGVPVYLDFWDTAGEEKYRSVTKRYLRSADIVLVCFEINTLAHKGEECITDWLKFIDEVTNTCQIFLVGTKLDLADLETRIAAASDVRSFSSEANNINSYYATSSVTGDGIDELLWAIVNTEITKRRPEPCVVPVMHESHARSCCK